MYFQDGETGEFEIVPQVGGMLALVSPENLHLSDSIVTELGANYLQLLPPVW